MDHGGIGYLTKDLDLVLPPDLLEPLAIQKDASLFGIYYPKPPEYNNEHPYTRDSYDFMLTPLPPRFWNKTARLSIKLKHKPGALNVISKYLADRKVSILRAEGTRSGFRYAMWSLSIIFEALGNNLTFSDDDGVYEETIDELYKLKENLIRDCKDYLFNDDKDVDHRDPIIAMPQTAMYYYRHLWDSMKKNKKQEKYWLHEPFVFKSNSQGYILNGGDRFKNIIKFISRTDKKELGNKNIEPAVVFAVLDNRYLNMRVSIIPSSKVKSFFECSFEYERSGPPDLGNGMIAKVTSMFPPDYNIWQLYNVTKSSSFEGEVGELVFFIEDTDTSIQSIEQCASKAKKSLNKLKPLRENIVFKEPIINMINLPSIYNKFSRNIKSRKNFEYDVFLSHSSLDAVLAKDIKNRLLKSGLTVFVSSDELKTGDDWPEEIRKAILDSREMAVLMTKSSMKSSWVQSEWGSAWVLGKKIVPITSGIEFSDLPERLLSKEGIDLDDIEKYVKQVEVRRYL